jgi:peptidoglycan/LPS O-acetylase OafA/YrhL
MIVPLTSLRGLAALAVMGFHFSALMGGFPIFDRGFLGVDLFFLLSGFILTHVYSKQLSVQTFLFARFARTYPLHLFTLLLLLPKLGQGEVYSANALFCNLTMTQVVCGGPSSWVGVSWSLSAEWLSYLLFPFVLRPLLKCPWWVAGIVIICCGGVLLSVSPITAEDNYRLSGLSRSLPEFLAGMILYRLYIEKWLAHRGYFVGAMVAAVAAFATHAPDILILATFAAIILTSPYVKIMEHKALAFLGDISYSLYLIHQLIGLTIAIPMVAIGIRNGPVIALMAMGASVLSASVIHRGVEVPARAWLRRWAGPPRLGRIEAPEPLIPS